MHSLELYRIPVVAVDAAAAVPALAPSLAAAVLLVVVDVLLLNHVAHLVAVDALLAVLAPPLDPDLLQAKEEDLLAMMVVIDASSLNLDLDHALLSNHQANPLLVAKKGNAVQQVIYEYTSERFLEIVHPETIK